MRKTLILTFFLIVVFTLNSKAQDFWEQLNTPDSINVSTVAFNSSGDVFMGSSNGVYKSNDEGEIWIHCGNLSQAIYNIVISTYDVIYAGASHKLYQSIDDGLTWQMVNSDLVIISLNITSNDILFCGNWGGLYKSIDSGYTWTQVISTVNTEVFNDIIEKDSLLFAGSVEWIGPNAGGVYRSFDQGDTWELSGMIGHGIYSFAIDIDSNLLAGVHVAPFSSSPGIYRCTDQGIIWENIYNQAYIGPVVVDPFGGIYAGLSATMGNPGWGIRFSDDNGITWTDLSSGMQYCLGVTGLAISPENYIYATTINPNYLYRSVNPIVSISEKRIKHFDIQVFPNPFQDRINLHINELNCNNKKLTIKIFNSLGQIIYSCENSVNNEFSINLEKLPSGLYYCSIRTETTEHNIKLIKN